MNGGYIGAYYQRALLRGDLRSALEARMTNIVAELLEVDSLSDRELEMAVAEEVMGAETRLVLNQSDGEQYTLVVPVRHDGKLRGWTPVPPYARSISDAWAVAVMLGLYVGPAIRYGETMEDEDKGWAATLVGYRLWEGLEPEDGFGETAPLAICRAAVKAKRAGRLS